MTAFTWTAQAAIAEQRHADRLVQAAAARLAGQTRSRPASTVGVGIHRRSWLRRRPSTRRPALGRPQPAITL